MAVIKKNAKGGRGTYATLAAVVNYADEQGYELEWPTKYISVDGHDVLHVNTLCRKKSEKDWEDCDCWIPVEVGDTRGMSVMQALGSALTYARRYSSCAAFGLATTDDDGETSGYRKREGGTMSDEQQQTVDRILEKCMIPSGQENAFISRILNRAVTYGTLTELQAGEFIDSYQRQQKAKEATNAPVRTLPSPGHGQGPLPARGQQEDGVPGPVRTGSASETKQG